MSPKSSYRPRTGLFVVEPRWIQECCVEGKCLASVWRYSNVFIDQKSVCWECFSAPLPRTCLITCIVFLSMFPPENTIHVTHFAKIFLCVKCRHVLYFLLGFPEQNTIHVPLLQNTVLFFPMSNVHMYCIFLGFFGGKYNKGITFANYCFIFSNVKCTHVLYFLLGFPRKIQYIYHFLLRKRH